MSTDTVSGQDIIIIVDIIVCFVQDSIFITNNNYSVHNPKL